MRNFLLLIRRYRNLLLFILLEIVSLVLISKSRNMQGVDITNSSNAVAAFFYKKQNDVVYYFQLRRLNDSLLQENARLHNQLASSSHIDTLRDTVSRVLMAARDTSRTNGRDTTKATYAGPAETVKYALYHYTPARVINNSISNDRINFITINRGKDNGIEPGMAVVTNSGIVGRVEQVSQHYATVASVLSDRRVSAMLSDGTFGTIIWEPGSPDYVYMEKVPTAIKVKKGDTIFTTGYATFPGNIMIGKVARVDTVKSSNEKTLKIALSTNFRNLQYVYVVKDKIGEERVRLEANTRARSEDRQNNTP